MLKSCVTKPSPNKKDHSDEKRTETRMNPRMISMSHIQIIFDT